MMAYRYCHIDLPIQQNSRCKIQKVSNVHVVQVEGFNGYYVEVLQKVQIFHVHTTDGEADDHVQIVYANLQSPDKSKQKMSVFLFFLKLKKIIKWSHQF